MSQISGAMWAVPGLSTPTETYEAAATWGQPWQMLISGTNVIASGTVDSGNSPTTVLRAGLLLGINTSTNQWGAYSATATSGLEIARGVLTTTVNMLNPLTNAGAARFLGILVRGPVQAANIIGLDNQARQQMSTDFTFDDNYTGLHYFPFLAQRTKTIDYSIASADNNYELTNLGAITGVTWTLPTIRNGFMVGVRLEANQGVTIASAEGGNIVGFNNASASNLIFATGNSLIGGGARIYSNPAGTLWEVDNMSAGANTITLS